MALVSNQSNVSFSVMGADIATQRVLLRTDDGLRSYAIGMVRHNSANPEALLNFALDRHQSQRTASLTSSLGPDVSLPPETHRLTQTHPAHMPRDRGRKR